jgi:hypothetical protein
MSVLITHIFDGIFETETSAEIEKLSSIPLLRATA